MLFNMSIPAFAPFDHACLCVSESLYNVGVRFHVLLSLRPSFLNIILVLPYFLLDQPGLVA
jgi:hypothetical protein